jgi:hypothetical protein
MTGIEPAAIAGAVIKTTATAVDRAVETEAKEAEALLRIAEKSGELDAAALIRAKRAVVKQHIRLKVMQPLGMLFGVPRDISTLNSVTIWPSAWPMCRKRKSSVLDLPSPVQPCWVWASPWRSRN